jgi:fumarate hydratase subunit alpha
MRSLPVAQLTEAVRRLCIDANRFLPEDVLEALQSAAKREESPSGQAVLQQLLENARLARQELVPLCQDTGFAILFVELGQDVSLTGGDYNAALQDGVRQGYKEAFLRTSILNDPLVRKNTGDNTPAIIYTEIVPGDKVKITVACKGGGSENMSAIKMLPPSAGVEGIKQFVLEQVKNAGANPCPPVIIGLGIGGTFDKCAFLAKKSLLRILGTRHPDPWYAALEEELLQKINNLGIGPMALGGTVTALAVHIETHPCHLVSLPVALNMQCHSARHKEIIL